MTDRHQCESYPLSVIVPIHRADVDVRRCLNSLLGNPFLDLQIIVAANSDNREVLHDINGMISSSHCIRLLNVCQAGKANVINHALRYVKYPYVLIGDADTLFIPHGINACVERLYGDETIIAITGIVEPIQTTLMTYVQKFEYRRVFRVFRPFWNMWNANLLISGCAGIFKTEALFQAGLYHCGTLGEDFEITLRLHDFYICHDIPYKIDYVNEPVAKTDVPDTLGRLIKQRGRWFAGQVDVMWQYRRILFHPFRYRKIFVPYVIAMIFEVFATILKWVFFGIGLGISLFRRSFFLKIVLMTGLCFVIFESLFNLCVRKRLKIRRPIWIIGLTLALIGLQFVLKDTNLIAAFRLRRKKENKWD